MDGNGRWAAARGLPRGEGHRRGVEALRRTVRAAGDLGVKVLTLYSFSAENWSRPADEIDDLMGLMKRFVRSDLADLNDNGVRVRIIGDREGLNSEILSLLQEAEELTRANDKFTLVVAFNYGGRQEIARAAQKSRGRSPGGQPRPRGDRRRGVGSASRHGGPAGSRSHDPHQGEQRLSNFLLWQAAYAEFVFLPIHWPEFDRAALEDAIDEYRRRERRFGGLTARAGS